MRFGDKTFEILFDSLYKIIYQLVIKIIFRWVEVWLRKRRQYICENIHNTVFFNHPDYTCRQADDDLRAAQCFNKNNNSLLEVMKTEIECGWSASSRIGVLSFLLVGVTAVGLIGNVI